VIFSFFSERDFFIQFPFSAFRFHPLEFQPLVRS
jgi:hypothetical protein